MFIFATVSFASWLWYNVLSLFAANMPRAEAAYISMDLIPINTLGAVNKFLENNVSARKKVQVSADGAEEPTRFRLGPHARRRATKTVYVEQAPDKSKDEPKESE